MNHPKGACHCDNGKPTETIPQSVAQRSGNSHHVKQAVTSQAVYPRAYGSRFGPAHEKAPPKRG